MNFVTLQDLKPGLGCGGRVIRSEWLCFGLGVFFAAHVLAAPALPEVLADKDTQSVFAGAARKVSILLRNVGTESANFEARYRLYQTSSATAVRLSETPWKRLQVLPGQTILETARLDFPAVKGETRCLIQWIDSENRVLGKTDVLVYPTNLLDELQTLAGDEPLGVFDPNNQLKPPLKSLGVEFLDLGNTSLEGLPGKLAIIGPFESPAQVRDDLAVRIRTLARKGAAIVWILPPTAKLDKLEPSFYSVAVGRGCIVVVQAGFLSELPTNPRSQLNLLQLARLALHPEPARLPSFPSQQ